MGNHGWSLPRSINSLKVEKVVIFQFINSSIISQKTSERDTSPCKQRTRSIAHHPAGQGLSAAAGTDRHAPERSVYEKQDEALCVWENGLES